MSDQSQRPKRELLRHGLATIAYFKADIVTGRVSSEQSPPRRQFE